MFTAMLGPRRPSFVEIMVGTVPPWANSHAAYVSELASTRGPDAFAIRAGSRAW
ncbi:hypothetical protein SCYAM73S_07710 [Streptomyces cyaneofuscatus]